MVEINIAFTSSNMFCGILSVAMASILRHSEEDENISFCIFSSDMTEENKRKLHSLQKIKKFNLQFVQLDSSEFGEYKGKINPATNFRLKIGSLLPQWDKVLFLDADLIVCHSLKKLWLYDLTHYHAAAVVDPGIDIQFEYTKKHHALFPERRFNTGVMLVNLAKWRQDNIEKKIFEAFTWYTGEYELWPDQNVLNMVLKDTMFELPHGYNACPLLAYYNVYHDKKALTEAFLNPSIIHYAAGGTFKPWTDMESPYSTQWWENARVSPFYESLLYQLFFSKAECLIKKEISEIAIKVNKTSPKISQWNIFRYRILAKCTWGKQKKRYKTKLKKFLRNPQ